MSNATRTRIFDQLAAATAADQQQLLQIPFVQAAQVGALNRQEYLAFLTQAYHHVKHTVPLLMATGAAIGADRPWLQAALCEYIAEEKGHDQWILNDIDAAGGDAAAVRQGPPGHACEVMVAYAYDLIARRDPIGFLGMVHVLEGTSVRAATAAAQALKASLGLPDKAFTYLFTHGDLDISHVSFFADLVQQIERPGEQAFVARCAQTFYRLYGDIFRSLSPFTHAPSNQENS